MRTKLSVNLNKVALLRNQRDLNYPSVTEMAQLAIAGGAEGITVHPRPDQRHIRLPDVHTLRKLLRTEYNDQIEFNVEGYPSNDFLELVMEVQPTQVTLVPDLPDQRTSDHGWELRTTGRQLASIVAELNPLGIRVALFVDPDPEVMSLVRDTGANRIELYTGPYAVSYSSGEYEQSLASYVATANRAINIGLGINAGHDLSLDNLPTFKRAIPDLAEVSIGHALTAHALRVGFAEAVKEYRDAVQ